MRTVYFITHPEVTIDPGVPVPDWSLSPAGLQRMHRVLEQRWLSGVRSIFSSCERKARDAARILADHLRLSPVKINPLGENDRSATGYLPEADFAAVADQFFARPWDSVICIALMRKADACFPAGVVWKSTKVPRYTTSLRIHGLQLA